jgi:hypothetical protein
LSLVLVPSEGIFNFFRADAKSTLLRNPFFAAWCPDVLDSYVEYAMHEREDGQIWLKMDRFQVCAKMV